MSHAAVAWANGVKGLRPAAKLVLLALADCHNPAFGCFPSQDYIAEVCEISRRSVNYHLAALEARGLILRHVSVHPETKRQRPTIYVLGFEIDPDKVRRLAVSGRMPRNAVRRNCTRKPPESGGDYQARAVCKTRHEPCAKHDTSRVQNLHTNLVREPLREPVTARASARERRILDWMRSDRPCPDPGWTFDDLVGCESKGLCSPREVMAAKARLSGRGRAEKRGGA